MNQQISTSKQIASSYLYTSFPIPRNDSISFSNSQIIKSSNQLAHQLIN